VILILHYQYVLKNRKRTNLLLVAGGECMPKHGHPDLFEEINKRKREKKKLEYRFCSSTSCPCSVMLLKFSKQPAGMMNV
jgi:hypothetical protein